MASLAAECISMYPCQPTTRVCGFQGPRCYRQHKMERQPRSVDSSNRTLVKSLKVLNRPITCNRRCACRKRGFARLSDPRGHAKYKILYFLYRSFGCLVILMVRRSDISCCLHVLILSFLDCTVQVMANE